MFATIYCLLYGDHVRLHLRLLKSLKINLPPGEARVVVWANAVCRQTAEWLRQQAPEDWRIVHSRENVKKYKLMRQMFHETHQPTTPWIVWFDDDSWVCKHDWWQKTRAYIKAQTDKGVCYIGQSWYVHHLPGQQAFIRAASWYRSKSWEMCATKTRGVEKPGITFAQGSYWWLRTDVMKEIDWPDPRLNHNGGDTLLGEAVRQQGRPFHQFHYGVKPNDSHRRGFNERPAGSSVNTRR